MITTVKGKNLYDYFKSNNSQFQVADNINEGLASVKYLHMGVDWTSPYMLDARGLVISMNGEIVARPYQKFFNYNQLINIPFIDDSIKPMCLWEDNEPFVVMDKLDGSLAIFYNHRNSLKIASSGNTAGIMVDIFEEALQEYTITTRHRLEEKTKYLTLMMEYVDPMNQIVIEYEQRKFVLHGARYTETGEYLSYTELVELGKYLNIEVVSIYPNIHSLSDLLNSLEKLKNKEGFVVWFENGKRLKFKTAEYLELHSLMENYAIKPYSKKKLERIAEVAFADELDDVMAEYAGKEYGKLAMRAFTDVLNFYVKYETSFIKAKELVMNNYEMYVRNKKEFLKLILEEDSLVNYLALELGKMYTNYVLKIKKANQSKDFIINNREFIYECLEHGGELKTRGYKYYDENLRKEFALTTTDREGKRIPVTSKYVAQYSAKKLKELQLFLEFSSAEDFELLDMKTYLTIDKFERDFIVRVRDTYSWTREQEEQEQLKRRVEIIKNKKELSTRAMKWV